MFSRVNAPRAGTWPRRDTMLTAAMDAEDALAKQVFDQTAGQGSGLGAEFGMSAFLEYFTYKGLKQRIVNDSKTTFPTNTTLYAGV